MSASPSEDEIMAPINASRYLMEQEVATLLEHRGLHVRTNVAFEDPEEGKSREIDVIAIQRVAIDEDAKLAAYVELLVECKNNTNPFVFIARPNCRTRCRLDRAAFKTRRNPRRHTSSGKYLSQQDTSSRATGPRY
jgi:hypothetical protein